MTPVRGLFQRPKKSGIWWIRYADANGRDRREKAGTKSMAAALYRKRKTEILQGRKLPETLRRKIVSFRELCEDAAIYACEHHQTDRKRDYRADRLIALFGNRPADSITPQDLERELTRLSRDRRWSPASYNRYKAFVSLAYRLGVESGKVQVNPARSVRHRRENNGRVRWLSKQEEAKLRCAIEEDYPAELPAFEIALHTGMRRSEQYRLSWDCVDLERRQITIPKTKNGTIRYIPLNDTALKAFRTLRGRTQGQGAVMVAGMGGHGIAKGEALKSPRMWFDAACRKAGVYDFTWHCLRHTYASRLVMAGVGLRDVQELMGHKTIAMTCRYAHLAPSHQLAAVRRLDRWAQAGRNTQNATGTKTGTGHFGGQESGGGKSVQVVVQ